MAKIIDGTNLGYLIGKIKAAFWRKSETSELTIDNSPTSGSNNLVKSGGVYTALSGKQETLVSGTNIKTVNNESLVGSGNITITGSGEANVIEAVTFNGTAATITNKTAAITATIPNEVTESTVSGWGFTKNTGTLTSESDPVFTASAAYGISSSDITNWNSKTSNTGTLTGVTFNNTAATVTNGVAAITATIPSEVTESTVSGWGFTKNVGTLTTETDPVFSASAASGITSSDITNWNGKTSNTGTVTGVKMNGTTNNPTSGVVDLGTVITSETSLSKGTTSGTGNAVTDISVSGHQITLTKGSTFLTSETSLSKGSDSGGGNVVTDISVSNHQITLTKGSTVPVATSANAGKIPRITSAGAWEYVTPSAIYSGSGTPSNGTGNNGDIYLQM